MGSVVTEYLGLLTKYKRLYGDNVAVLMQVGSFYEMYGVDNKAECIGRVAELSRLLNIVLTKRNKRIEGNSRHNPLMLGFPCLALDKYIPILLEEDYTIVVVKQEKTRLSIRRVVSDIISASTYMESSRDEYMALVYVEVTRSGLVHTGVSVINVITGKSAVYECYSTTADARLSLDKTVSFVQQYSPREIVLSSKRAELIKDMDNFGERVKYFYREVNQVASNVSYQNAVLGLVFENSTMLSNIELLDLERRPYALMSYVLLVEFVHSHNPMLISRISSPEIFEPLNHLVLATNTAEQLNIVGSARSKSLFGVVNSCSTSVGKRLLKERLMSPISDALKLEERYQHVDDFGSMFSAEMKGIEATLSKVADIERLQRRMSMGIMAPSELASMVLSYKRVVEVHENICGKSSTISSVMLTSKDVEKARSFVDTCSAIFNTDLADSSYIFCRGVFDRIDAIGDRIAEEKRLIEGEAQAISEAGKTPVRIEQLPNIGHHLTVTNARAAKLREELRGTDVIHGLSFRHFKVTTRITSHKIDLASKNIIELEERLRSLSKKCYCLSITKLHREYGDMFCRATKSIAELDVIKSNFKTSMLYGYCRPKIDNREGSFINAAGLRHPIMERIDKGTEYVPNDISIGEGHNGIVLYSMNAGGKTSLLKACGLSVILAQIGGFVPASSYIFSPFRCIMTRILSEDNSLRGQSSFVSEMSELRGILKRADGRTLVLADEITHGTEHTSGSAIFTSSVITLAERAVNFVFTTHLHNVYTLIKDISNVRVCHLSVCFRDGVVVFERKLKEGPGDSIYGLEVCESLNMDAQFLAKAFEVRGIIEHSCWPKIKQSRYNTKKIVSTCEMCGYYRKAVTDMPLDTHHIRGQCTSDKNGMVGDVAKVHKNSRSNLVVLCKQCHTRVHTGGASINGYISTTRGTSLSF